MKNIKHIAIITLIAIFGTTNNMFCMKRKRGNGYENPERKRPLKRRKIESFRELFLQSRIEHAKLIARNHPQTITPEFMVEQFFVATENGNFTFAKKLQEAFPNHITIDLIKGNLFFAIKNEDINLTRNIHEICENLGSPVSHEDIKNGFTKAMTCCNFDFAKNIAKMYPEFITKVVVDNLFISLEHENSPLVQKIHNTFPDLITQLIIEKFFSAISNANLELTRKLLNLYPSLVNAKRKPFVANITLPETKMMHSVLIKLSPLTYAISKLKTKIEIEEEEEIEIEETVKLKEIILDLLACEAALKQMPHNTFDLFEIVANKGITSNLPSAKVQRRDPLLSLFERNAHEDRSWLLLELKDETNFNGGAPLSIMLKIKGCEHITSLMITKYDKACSLFAPGNENYGQIPLEYADLIYRHLPQETKGYYVSRLHFLLYHSQELPEDLILNASEALKNGFNDKVTKETPLHAAMSRFLTDKKISLSGLLLLEKLITEKNKNLQNDRGQTPLHILTNLILHHMSTTPQLCEFMKKLISLENLNLTDELGNTPISLLAKSMEEYKGEILKHSTLASFHEEYPRVDIIQILPLLKALKTEESIRTRGVDNDTAILNILKTLSYMRKIPEEYLVFLNETITTADIDEEQLLHACVEERYLHKSLVELLLSKVRNINERNAEGNSILHLLLKNPNLTREIKIAATRLLIRENIDINIKNEKNETPLYLTIKIGSKELVKILLDEREEDIKKETLIIDFSLSQNMRTFLIQNKVLFREKYNDDLPILEDDQDEDGAVQMQDDAQDFYDF